MGINLAYMAHAAPYNTRRMEGNSLASQDPANQPRQSDSSLHLSNAASSNYSVAARRFRAEVRFGLYWRRNWPEC